MLSKKASRLPKRIRSIVSKLKKESGRSFVWVSDEKQKVLYVSNGFSTLTGIPTSQILEEGWESIVEDKWVPELKSSWARAQEEMKPWSARYSIKGQKNPVIWEHIAIPVNGRHPLYWIGTTSDVTCMYPEEEESEKFRPSRWRIQEQEAPTLYSRTCVADPGSCVG